MENASFGINPEEDFDEVMKDIEKNLREELQNNEQIVKNDPYAEDSDENLSEEDLQEMGESSDEDDHAIVEGEAEEETVNEADLYREKYYLEKKKRKSVLADRQKLVQENYELKNALGGTIDSNTELYARDLYNDLEKAKSLKKQALLGDDPDLLLDADEIHQRLLHKVNEFESHVSRNSAYTNNIDDDDEKLTAPTEDYEEQIKLSNAQEWIDEHPELIPDSDTFNPKIQKELGVFIKKFDKELRKEGREDEILSQPYLDVLEEFVDSVKITKPKDGYTTSNVGGVRNNFSNGSTGTIKVTMSDFEKNYAKNLGITEKEYLKYKIEDIKESKNRR
jgi:hypothetical protein